jgi:hypothetical protein
VSLFQRLRSPKLILFIGVFDTALGVGSLLQRKTRGQGVLLTVMGGVLVLAGLLLVRVDARRARPPSAARRRPVRPAAPVPVKARGPKAGPKSRLAGPSREKAPAQEVSPRRLFRKREHG